jgi:23S rRNA (cytidine1920-2'-O)/16S rRNA (cytidine1409-2'-O)-methyltransferase
LRLIKEGALLIALIKPQFEVEKGEVGNRGVVRDPALLERVLAEIEVFCRSLGLSVLGSCESPLTGPAGNREFFICLKKLPDKGTDGGAGEKEWA